MPVADRCRVTDTFGYQEWRGYTHTGVDFGGPNAGVSVDVKAAAAGTVEFTHGSIPLRTGPQIKIRHPDGSATTYGHTRKVVVKAGQKVVRGQKLADTWHTGLKASAGIHLHFEWWSDADDHTTRHDPMNRLADYGWVLKYDKAAGKYRLHDEWGGRPTKSDPAATHTPASTPQKDWLSMATEAEVRKIVKEENDALYDRLVTLGGLSWAKVGHNGENLRQLLWESAKGAQAGFVNTEKIKSTNSEVAKAVAEASKTGALTPDQVSDLVDSVSAAAEKGAASAVEAGITVDVTATASANKGQK